MITLWVEGYAATGDGGPAKCLGTWPGDTYAEAVLNWRMAKWSSSGWGSFKSHTEGKFDEVLNGQFSVWGCHIFDNEEDARRSFG